MSPASPNPASESPLTPKPDAPGGIFAGWPWLRRVLMVGLDVAVLAIAFGLAYEIGFLVQPDRFTGEYHRQFLCLVPFLVLFRMIWLWRLGLYRGFSRYTGIYELTTISLAGLAGTAGLVIFNLVSPHIGSLGSFYPTYFGSDQILRVPKGVILIDLLLSINGLAGVRLSRRIIGERLVDLSSHDRRRVLIVGAQDAGEQIARNLLKIYRDRYKPVAFIAADHTLIGRRIHGLPVAGRLEDLVSVCRRFRADMAIIALQRTTPRVLRMLIDEAREERLEFKIIPELNELIQGHFQINQLRSVEIEDLLGRPPVVVGDQTGHSILSGRRVLVTGAGGSIGSELCRQALAHRPESLILLGRGENSIYEIHRELAAGAAAAGIRLETVIGDVRDQAVIDRTFGEFRPQVVLHAAAHKHVHFMEAQPAEAIKNNVRGTRLVAQAALSVGAERFILISTDKAVRPTGVMGASKRVAEMVVTALNRHGSTRFICVRFGNVLGSRGSVIPLFRRQIAEGGPITVTHPDVTRYFMTIPEAVSLVLEAGSQGEGGEVFLLDMGEPVRIVDLARQLITLSGLEPGRDIAIEFTGLRPGEKLYEELLTDEENRQPTAHAKIFRSPRPAPTWENLAGRIERLEALALAEQVDEGALRAMLHELIPDYREAPRSPAVQNS